MAVMPDGQYRALSDEDRAALNRIEEGAEIASRAYDEFRRQQTSHGGEITSQHKADLRQRLQRLGDDLDRYLPADYGVDPDDAAAHAAWCASHQPFHWFVEFYGTMSKGGFDVVIGNPPYIQWRRVSDYTIRGYETSVCPDIYAACVERSMQIATNEARFGMILPISFQFSSDFERARVVVSENARTVWASTFSRNPAALFNAGLGVRSSIVVAHLSAAQGAGVFTTRLNRWIEEFRPILFQTLEYGRLPPALSRFGWVRTGNERVGELFEALVSRGDPLARDGRAPKEMPKYGLRFKTTALYFISVFFDDPPSFDYYGNQIEQTKVGSLFYSSSEEASLASALSLGKIALLWWASTGDDFDVTVSGLGRTPVGGALLPDTARDRVMGLAREIEEELQKNIMCTRYAGKWMGNYDVKTVRHLTDAVDHLVLDALGLDRYWEDLELEYVRFMKMTGERPGTTREKPDFGK